jgi:hypothetical protein
VRAHRLLLLLLAALCAGCTASAPPPVEGPPAGSAGERWAPPLGATWQYQLQDEIDTSVDADVYVVDLFNVDASVVADLHDEGRRVACYVSVGTLEAWREDAHRFPAEVVGRPLPEWPGETWLDVRRLDVLEPLLADRFDLCRSKGFDAVDPDNVDGFTQDSGFPLQAEDQLRFNRTVARLARDRGLGVGLKNDLLQVPELVDDFDFAVNESCVEEEECGRLRPFVDRGKAVLHVEYDIPPAEFCPVTAPLGFSSIAKPVDLTAPVEPCPA